MYLSAKIICIVLYLAAASSVLFAFPQGLAQALQYAALLFLIVHVLEIILCLRYVRLYQGPLAISIALTLLFGALHWKPMLDASKRNQHNKP